MIRNDPCAVTFRVAERVPIKFAVENVVKIGDAEQIYQGPYEVTPTTEAQRLETAGKSMRDNVVVNPIPNNYGLITYHQDRTITIS